MDKKYWLSRKRSHAASARDAASSEARLIHLDLAGRYSVKAAEAGAGATKGAPNAKDYEQLETGARWLASQSATGLEREEHLSMANKYARLRLDAAAATR